MSSINNGYNRNRIPGLASGVDTQGMVDAMLAGTKAKIEKQNALKQQSIWKQSIYRDVISTLTSFQNKFFSFSSPTTNLLSQSLYNSMSSTTSSKSVKVTGTSNASSGKVEISSIDRLAQKRKEESVNTVSKELVADVDMSKFEKRLSLQIDGTTQDINFAGKTEAEIVASLNTDLQAKFAGDVSASIVDGKLLIEHVDPNKKISVVGGSDLGYSVLGIKGSTSGDGSISGKIDLSKNTYTLNINFDGITKNVNISAGVGNINDLVDEINSQLRSSFGSGLAVKEDAGKLVFETFKTVGTPPTLQHDPSRSIVINGDDSTLEVFGVKKGASNKVNLLMSLKDAGFNVPIQGSKYEFSINGAKISGSTDDSIGVLISKINGSGAGVRVSYSAIEDKFSIESNTYGKDVEISMSQEKGNVLTSIFGGVKSGSSVESGKLYDKSKITSTNNASLDKISGGDFTMNVGGSNVVVKVPKRTQSVGGVDVDDPYTRAEFVDALNDELNKSHSHLGLSFEIDGDKTVLKNTSDRDVTFVNNDASKKLGFVSGQSNKNSLATGDTLLSSVALDKGIINIFGQNFDLSSYSSTSTINDLVNDVNTYIKTINPDYEMSFDETSGTLNFDGITDNEVITFVDADGQKAMKNLFGSEVVEFSSALASGPSISQSGTVIKEEGESALITLGNGTQIERNNNVFDLDGIKVELLETTNEKTVIDTTRDTSTVTKAIEDFVKDYNEMVGKISGLLGEETNYKKYPPLTDQQRKEMSESEIKLWEERAKEGLVRNDPFMASLLSTMRGSLYDKPEGAKYSLFDLGITTGSWNENGKLVIDINNDRILNALENDPHEVQKLFTDATSGLAVKLNEALNASTRNNGTRSLVDLAGLQGSPNSNNKIGKDIIEIEKRLSKLDRQYRLEESRYWRQFEAMEKAVAAMNQQSTWFMSQM
ncbi:MAG: flagellar filament capping protein FliD [Oscillospiraceae bacterium]